MISIESIGWLALALNVWGNLSLVKKSPFGWLVRLACNVAWIVYSYIFNIYPLLINHILFAGINIYGWIQWTKSKPKEYHYYCLYCHIEYGTFKKYAKHCKQVREQLK